MRTLNERAWAVADAMEANAEQLRISVSRVAGTRIIDCGGAIEGSLAAGVMMGRACLADLADVSLVPSPFADLPGPAVQVTTDHATRACLASQYAGWQVKAGKYFAMGSGPMRAASAREPIFADIGYNEEPPCAVGVLEANHHPTEEAVTAIVQKLPTSVEKLTLLVAPAASVAGAVQVVARSVETALHKLHELKFDVKNIVSGFGVAPLPPVAKDDLNAIGRPNDAILYGGRVTLWVRADDEQLAAIGPKVPSTASKDHGAPFAELYARYGNFYDIDPMLFSPAEVTFVNLKTGRAFTFGRVEAGLLRKSFFGV
ncbi:methenyltetrahydromethanopterin cyclohydrolase [Limnoglobus roseus]|uniref:Methenyltetrahydromethanopterin cyclohydrolase n=1 Tax=Limnoglobus roseus TaxID=2598579 RepID=A0A5C1ACG9_9BACT|nr:methenyltetrahydromethanopterin cyclohydrolase [Limnoglobus roseus]QEL15837.1 methenyltetrahydromethanopterin cyclohydrolase [Limnoglobus roseus]